MEEVETAEAFITGSGEEIRSLSPRVVSELLQGYTSGTFLQSRFFLMRSHFLVLLIASTLPLLACSSESPVAPSPPAGSPDIALSPTSMGLCYPRCPASSRGRFNIDYVTITNSGTGALSWRSSSNSSWLKRFPISGGAPSTVHVRVDGTGMARGQSYKGEITFTVVDHADKTAVLAVTMYVP